MLAEMKHVPVRRSDMATLKPGECLNGEIVNLFFKILAHQTSAATAESPACWFMNSLFLPKTRQITQRLHTVAVPVLGTFQSI